LKEVRQMEKAVVYPLGDRLKVLPLKPAETTESGIVIPEVSERRDRPMAGIVLAVGRGRETMAGLTVELECEEGDIVHFGRFAGIYVYDESVGQDVLLMREDEALGRQLANDIELVLHEGYHVRHVPGDPRCEQCRAGRRLVEA